MSRSSGLLASGVGLGIWFLAGGALADADFSRGDPGGNARAGLGADRRRAPRAAGTRFLRRGVRRDVPPQARAALRPGCGV